MYDIEQQIKKVEIVANNNGYTNLEFLNTYKDIIRMWVIIALKEEKMVRLAYETTLNSACKVAIHYIKYGKN
jgi:hypothetical protein